MRKICLKVWNANVLIAVGAIILTIICVIMLIKPNHTYYFEGEMLFDNGVRQENVPIYTNIELPVGVYDIILEYKSDASLNSLITAVDGTVFYGGLLTNGEPLYKNLTHTDYRMWLLENTEALQVVLTYGGEGRVNTGNLMICETNLLWIQILVITWSIVLVWFVLCKIRKYDEVVGIEKDKKNIVVGLFVIILLSSIPFMQKGFLSGGDLGYHLLRIEGVKDGILSGQFPLRLEPEWLCGHGYANSVFYCNTLLYIPALFRLLGFTVGTSYRLFGIFLNVFTVGIAYWCFSRMFKDRYIGLLCSALHTLSIYRLYKLVVCGAVGESSAFMFLPLILYGFYRAFTQDVNDKTYKTVWIPIAAGYTGVMQTHVLSCEILAFLTVFVCIFLIKKVLIKQTFLVLAKGAIAAVLMSIWYWVPFLDFYINEDVHIHYVSARQIQNQGVYLAQLFFHWWRAGSNPLPGDNGMTDSDAMGVGFVWGFGAIARDFQNIWKSVYSLYNRS